MVKMTVDAMGDHCPIPVVKTKKALGKLQGAGQIEVLVDNETAMKNVMKMAKSSGASAESEKISDREYKVMITVEEKNAAVSESDQKGQTAGKESRAQAEGGGKEAGESDHNPAAENGSNSSAQETAFSWMITLWNIGCKYCDITIPLNRFSFPCLPKGNMSASLLFFFAFTAYTVSGSSYVSPNNSTVTFFILCSSSGRSL